MLDDGEGTARLRNRGWAPVFGFSVVVGILAGILPGLKAARLNPIQALRYE